jgi:type I site-specific restriction endonuclease
LTLKQENEVKGYEHKPKPKPTKGKETIANYFKEWTAFQPELEKMKYEGVNVSDNHTYQNLKQKKMRVLDTVFQSMANLTEFMEYIAENEKLQQVFDDDLEQLFLSTPERSQPTFTRFIDAVTKCDFSKKENVENNFRLALINIMQRTIFYRIASISPHKTDRTVSDAIIGPEFGRAWAWTQYFASNVDLSI